MTSYFARHGTLSHETRASAYYGLRPRNLDDRLIFYINYLQDVVPHGLTVQHIPKGLPNNKAEEIHLLTPEGYIFMTGLVRRDRNPQQCERVAGDEAFSYYCEGEFAKDAQDEQNWRFFTGHDAIRFFKSHGGDSWEEARCYYPMNDTEEVAEDLQEEYRRHLGH